MIDSVGLCASVEHLNTKAEIKVGDRGGIVDFPS